MKISPWLLCILSIAALTLEARGAQSTITAASCQQADVNAVINGPTHTAVDGDTIQIPAGTCTWTNGIEVPKGVGITIAGSGTPNNTPGTTGAATGGTTIVDAVSGSQVFVAYPSFGNSTMRISMLTIQPSGGSQYSPLSIWGTCSSSGCPNIRIDNITFPASWAGISGLQDNALVLTDNVFGVLDHNTVTGSDSKDYVGFANFSHGKWMGAGQFGDNSWTQPDTFGTGQAIYLENNLFQTNVLPVDCDTSDAFTDTGGCRYVARFNTIADEATVGNFGNHGTETTGRPRGGRQTEIYNNSLSCSNTSSGCDSGVGLRSSVSMVFDNTFTAMGSSWYNSYLTLGAYRSFSGFDPWGFCNGQGPWDSNDGTVYASGTITSSSVSNGTLTVADGSKSWANGQWLSNGSPYSIVDTSVTSTAGSWTGHPGYEISASGANSVSAANYGQDYWNGPPTFNVGDSYQILRAKVCIDQPSRSGGTLLSGTTPTTTGWVNQVLDPSYEWGDTHTGNFGGQPVRSDTARLIANRDYYYQISPSAQSSPSSPFNGTSGTGFGTLSNRPATCTTGVGYWATDEGTWNKSGNGGQGQLYTCESSNTWSLKYTPYAYPHPVITGGSAPTGPSGSGSPTNLSGSAH